MGEQLFSKFIFEARPGVHSPGLVAFGELVAGRRSSLGLSLRQLGESSGINYSWLSRIEKGEIRVMPSVDGFVGLARSLDVSVCELLISAGVDASLVLPVGVPGTDTAVVGRLSKGNSQ